jgi:hypothetical protein
MKNDPKEVRLPQFDPDLTPQHETNKKAAEARGLTFHDGCYRDEDGAMARDQFGQPY